MESCTFFESAIALFQKIAGDLVFSLIPILFIESSTSPLAISLMELRRIQFSVKLSKQKKKKEKKCKKVDEKYDITFFLRES